MSNTAMSSKKHKPLILHEHEVVLPIILIFCGFVLFIWVLCLMPSVTCVSGLSILDCPFGVL